MIKYFITDFGSGVYAEAEDTDSFWITNGSTSILVPKRPGNAYVWNLENNYWEQTPISLAEYYLPLRNAELRRTEIYKFDPGLSDEQVIERDNYYASLYNLSYADPSTFVFPKCPNFMLL